MNPKNLLPIKNLKQSFKLFKLNWRLVPVSVLIDMVFLFSLGFIVGEIYTKLLDHLIPMVGIMEEAEIQVNSMITSQIDLITALSQRALFMDHYISVILLAILFIVIAYALYSILQGINWFIANKIANKKVNLCRFLARFSFVNLIWFILLILIGMFFVKFFISASTSLTPIVSPIIITYTTISMLAIVIYFGLISYSLINKSGMFKALKNTFITGTKKFKSIILTYITIMILFLIVDLILRITYTISPTVMIITGIIIAMPLITFTRIYLIESIK